MDIVMVIAAWCPIVGFVFDCAERTQSRKKRKGKWCLGNRKASRKTVSETTSIIRSQRDWKPS